MKLPRVSSLPFPRFIVLEGGDGSGKTSIRKLLFRWLAVLGRTPLSLTGTSWMHLPSTEIITKAKYFKEPYPRHTILRAYAEDRYMLDQMLIRPMRQHRDVISDRYCYSDIVYNEIQYGIDRQSTVHAYRELSLSRPDLLIFLDTPPKLAVERLVARGRPINHWETLEKQEMVYWGLKEVLDADPMKWNCPVHIVDNTRPPDEVARNVLEITGLEFETGTNPLV